MITNLLDISKADEGKLAPVVRAIDADALVRAVLDELDQRASAAGVRIEVAVAAPQLHADPDLIGRVLANLIDNAIHHAPEGTSVRVEVAQAVGGVEVRVTDAGPGCRTIRARPCSNGFVAERLRDAATAASGLRSAS